MIPGSAVLVSAACPALLRKLGLRTRVVRTEVESTSVDDSTGAAVVLLGRKRLAGLRLGTTRLSSPEIGVDVSSVLLGVVVRMLGLRARIPANPLVVAPLGASVDEFSGLEVEVVRLAPGRRPLIKLATSLVDDSEIVASVVVVRMLGRRISPALVDGFAGASVEMSAAA